MPAPDAPGPPGAVALTLLRASLPSLQTSWGVSIGRVSPEGFKCRLIMAKPKPEQDEKGQFLPGNNGGSGRPQGYRAQLGEAVGNQAGTGISPVGGFWRWMAMVRAVMVNSARMWSCIAQPTIFLVKRSSTTAR